MTDGVIFATGLLHMGLVYGTRKMCLADEMLTVRKMCLKDGMMFAVGLLAYVTSLWD